MITLSKDDNMLNIVFKNIQKVEQANINEYGADTVLDEIIDDDIDVVEIQNADRSTVQKRVWKFVQQLMGSKEMFHRDKKELLLPYEEIRRNEDRLKEKEKINIMSRFDPRNESEHKVRRAEKDLKKFHLDKYYINQKVIKTYGIRRDKMLNTEDADEEAILFRDLLEKENTNIAEIDEIFGITEDQHENNDEIYAEIQDENIDWGDDEDDHVDFIRNPYEDDDQYDIAENALYQ
jgi:hypothetical protein